MPKRGSFCLQKVKLKWQTISVNFVFSRSFARPMCIRNFKASFCTATYDWSQRLRCDKFKFSINKYMFLRYWRKCQILVKITRGHVCVKIKVRLSIKMEILCFRWPNFVAMCFRWPNFGPVCFRWPTFGPVYFRWPNSITENMLIITYFIVVMVTLLNF